MKTCDAYPLELALPGGIRAQLVPGSRPPRYTINGEPTALDITIPTDLLATGWCWFGTLLYQPYPGRDDGPGVGIITCTYPPPGWNYTLTGRILFPGFWCSCFIAARRMDLIHAEYEAARRVKLVAPKKAKRTAKAAPAPVVEQVGQLVMEF